MKLSIMTCTLTMGLASLACGRNSEPQTANDGASHKLGEAGAEVGEAIDEAGEGAERETERAIEKLGLEGRKRYRCETGEEFVVEFKEEGSGAIVERNDRLYRLQREEGTGRFTSDQGRLLIIDETRATVEIEGEPPMRNCQRW